MCEIDSDLCGFLDLSQTATEMSNKHVVTATGLHNHLVRKRRLNNLAKLAKRVCDMKNLVLNSMFHFRTRYNTTSLSEVHSSTI